VGVGVRVAVAVGVGVQAAAVAVMAVATIAACSSGEGPQADRTKRTPMNGGRKPALGLISRQKETRFRRMF
jgi:hypothetical protein